MSIQEQSLHEVSGTLKSYITGFILSLLLTAVAFGIVMMGDKSVSVSSGAAIGIIACAVLQLIVQIYFFLHLDGRKSQLWDTICGLYTLIIIFAIVGGSMWIFYHLHINTGLSGY